MEPGAACRAGSAAVACPASPLPGLKAAPEEVPEPLQPCAQPAAPGGEGFPPRGPAALGAAARHGERPGGHASPACPWSLLP